MDYIIETENLTKKYGMATVVRNVNIHLPKGKIYGLLGRNGAGKTTAMKMMLQLVRPTTGTIKLFGSDYREDPKRLYSKIGSIIETPGFYHNLTAYENLELLERLRGLSSNKDNNKVKKNLDGYKDKNNNKNTEGNNQKNNKKDDKIKALEIVGLDKERTKPFADYSLGMKQRLGIAAAIMHNPELLILDEPINGLDPIGISEIRLLLSELSRKRGTTILISSHVLSEIEQIADVIGVMHEGQLIEEVNMDELNKRKRRYLEFEVSNTMGAVKLLESRYQITEYSVLGNTIKVYDCTKDCGEINKTFIENEILVTKVNQCEENLEEYFSELIGGGGIA